MYFHSYITEETDSEGPQSSMVIGWRNSRSEAETWIHKTGNPSLCLWCHTAVLSSVKPYSYALAEMKWA